MIGRLRPQGHPLPLPAIAEGGDCREVFKLIQER